MRTRKEVEESGEKILRAGLEGSGSMADGVGVVMGHVALSLEVLLDIRELLQQKNKPRRILVEEAEMTDREREIFNSLEEKDEE